MTKGTFTIFPDEAGQENRDEDGKQGRELNDVPVVRPRVTETTALGAAYAAGLAAGTGNRDGS